MEMKKNNYYYLEIDGNGMIENILCELKLNGMIDNE